MEDKETKSYTLEEIQEVALALGQVIDSCNSLMESAAVLQEFPFTGKYDQPLAMTVASMFLVGMTYAGTEILRRREEMQEKGTFVCPN